MHGMVAWKKTAPKASGITEQCCFKLDIIKGWEVKFKVTQLPEERIKSLLERMNIFIDLSICRYREFIVCSHTELLPFVALFPTLWSSQNNFHFCPHLGKCCCGAWYLLYFMQFYCTFSTFRQVQLCHDFMHNIVTRTTLCKPQAIPQSIGKC